MTTSQHDSETGVTAHLRAAAEALAPPTADDPKAVHLHISLARCLLAAGAAQDARLLADRLAAVSSLAVTALRIDTALASDDFPAALTRLEAGRAHFPQETLYLRRKLGILRRAGRTEDILPLLEALHSADPEDTAILLQLGRARRLGGEGDLADSAFAAVLAQAPRNVAAWLGRCDVALDRQDPAAACALAEAALEAVPEAPEIATRAARLMMRTGRTQEARDRLEHAIAARGGASSSIPVEMQMTRALLLRELGDEGGADAIYGQILETTPDHAGAWGGRIQTALAQSDVDRALALTDAARAECPDVAMLERLRATVLRRGGREDEALRVLETLHSRTPEDLGTTLALADACRTGGRLAAADALYAEVLARNPESWPALRGRANIAETRGDLTEATRLLGGTGGGRQAGPDAETDRGGDPDTDPDPGSDTGPDTGPDTGSGSDPASGSASDRNADLNAAPDAAPAMAAGTATAPGTTRGTTLGTSRGATAHTQAARLSPARLLRLAELGFKSDDAAQAEGHLAQLATLLGALDDAQLTQFMDLADRGQRPDLAAEAIRQAAARPTLRPGLALAVLRRAHGAEDETLAEDIDEALAACVPPHQRLAFRNHAARMRHGPEAAFALLRENRMARRTPVEAARLAGALLATGRTALALRYLRLCHRRWPKAVAISRTLVNAWMRSGRPDAARALLAQLAPDSTPRDMEEMQLQIAIDTGDLDAAMAIMTRQVSEGYRKAGDLKILRTLIAQGRLEEAEAAVETIRTDPMHGSKYVAHFSVVLFGQMLNELRMYRRAVPRDLLDQPHQPRTNDPLPRTQVGANFFAAKEMLDSWQAEAQLSSPLSSPAIPAATAVPPVPRRIFQYWNTPDVPPAVAEIMASWQGRPGWEYRLFDRRRATDWLRSTFGPRHARAFTLANHVAEESDFLRLYLLWSEGGIYADADDKLVGTPEGLLDHGPGMVAFREPFGAIANNLICAPPRHRVLDYAVKRARAALMRRDNESTWLKAGPGLLTRAVALHVLDNPAQAARDLTLVPSIEMRQQVHPHIALPYKSTRKYWNAKNPTVDRTVETTLHSLRQGAAG